MRKTLEQFKSKLSIISGFQKHPKVEESEPRSNGYRSKAMANEAIRGQHFRGEEFNRAAQCPDAALRASPVFLEIIVLWLDIVIPPTGASRRNSILPASRIRRWRARPPGGTVAHFSS